MRKIILILIITFVLSSCENNNNIAVSSNSSVIPKTEDIEFLREYGNFVNNVITSRNSLPYLTGTYRIFRDNNGEVSFSYNEELPMPTSGTTLQIFSDTNGNLKSIFVYDMLNMDDFEELNLIQEYFLENDKIFIKSYENSEESYLYIENDITYYINTDTQTIETLPSEYYFNFYKFGLQLNKVFTRKNNDMLSETLITTTKSQTIEDFIPFGWSLYNRNDNDIKGLLSGNFNNDKYNDYLVTIERNNNDYDTNNEYIFPRISFVLFGTNNGFVLNNFFSDLITPYYTNNNDAFKGFTVNGSTIFATYYDLNNDRLNYICKYLFDNDLKKWQLVGFTKTQIKDYTYNSKNINYTVVEDYNLINGRFRTSINDNDSNYFIGSKEFLENLDPPIVYYNDDIHSIPNDIFFSSDNHLKYLENLLN